ncbi:TP53-regulating kinase [Trichinella pseudospiralis]|uniref:non-specific serine/threonine protein kinase n=1 Tax=Trichinella pseudospiralis TaxID=6337 RepID=A0A0V1EPN0_TRIPS|nr:TP53-regulating kinase [Trichinella pseudospiralis]
MERLSAETASDMEKVGNGNENDSELKHSVAARSGSQNNNAQASSTCFLSFNEKLEKLCEWMAHFTDDEKNIVVSNILLYCGPEQLKPVADFMESSSHNYFSENAVDPFELFPSNILMHIFSFLEPIDIASCALVSKLWNRFVEYQGWKSMCLFNSNYRLASTELEQKLTSRYCIGEGRVEWKGIFLERYRLRRNWMKARISCVQFDENRIVSGSSDKSIKLWDIRTNNPLAVMTLLGHSGTVRCLQLNGSRLASGSNDHTLKVWDLSSNEHWSSIACRSTMIGHTDAVRCLQMDDEKIISGSYDKTLRTWDLKTGQQSATFSGHEGEVLCLQFDRRKLISGSSDRSIRIWDLRTQIAGMILHNVHAKAVTCLQFNETQIVSASFDCTIKVWDVRTGRCFRTINWKENEGHTGVVRCLQADRWRFVSGADDKTLKVMDALHCLANIFETHVWNLNTGERICTLHSHTDGVTCLSFNDFRIVSGSYDTCVKLIMQSCSSEKKIGFSDSTVTLIAQGAEARIFSTNFYGKPAIIKERFRKKYRHFALDELLTKERMRAEIRGLMHCRKLGIPVPPIYFVDSKQNSIIFGAVEDAITLKNLLDSMHEAGAVVDLVDNLALTIGQVLAKMHMNGVIHGDLTTSNLLVKRPLSADNCRQIVLIDFGLSFVSSMVEDKAVDLLVLEKAFMSTHPNAESFYRTILDAYAKFYGKQGSEVLAQLEQVRLRGRKRLIRCQTDAVFTLTRNSTTGKQEIQNTTIRVRAKSSGTEIFEGRLCMNSADGWLILLSMLQSLTWEASFYYSEQVENQSKQLHVWHHSEAKLISKFMSSIHIQGIR